MNLKKISKIKRKIAFVLVLTIGFFSKYLGAQGLFSEASITQNGNNDVRNGLFNYAPREQTESQDNELFNITNEDFVASIGNGVIVLLSAGIGYLTFKKKQGED